MDINEFRKNYPQYDEVPDAELAKSLHGKYYADMDYGEFSAKFIPQATVAQEPSPSPSPAQEPSFREQVANTYSSLWKDVPVIGDTMAAAGPAVARGLVNVPAGLAQGGMLVGDIATGKELGGTERLARSLSPTFGKALDVGAPSTPTERMLLEQSPVTSGIAEFVPAALAPGKTIAKEAPRLAKMGTAMLEGLAGSQATTYETPEDRLKGGAWGAVGGGAVERVGAAVSPLWQGAKKYLPFTDKKALAAEELSGVVNKSSGEMQAITKRTEQILGKDVADNLALYDLLDDPEVLNKAKAFAAQQNEEGAALIKKAMYQKEASLATLMKKYNEDLRLSPKESAKVSRLVEDVLPKSRVTSDDYNKLTSDPIIRNQLFKLQGRDLPEYREVEEATLNLREARRAVQDIRSEMRNARLEEGRGDEALVAAQDAVLEAQRALDAAKDSLTKRGSDTMAVFNHVVGGHSPRSGLYWDTVRRHLQTQKVASSGDTYAAYNAAVRKIDEALEKPLGADYQELKALQQRAKLARDFDDKMSGVSQAFSEGRLTDSIKALKGIYKGKNFSDLMESASYIKDPVLRKKKEEQLHLIASFVGDVDTREAARMLGSQDTAAFRGGGVVPMAVTPSAKFLRGEYNKSLAYLIDHPQDYIDYLKQVEKIKEPRQRFISFTQLLGRIEAGAYRGAPAQEDPQ